MRKYVWNKRENIEKNWKIAYRPRKSNDYSIIKILDLWPFKTSGPIEKLSPTLFLEIKKSAENSEWVLNRLIYYNKSEECSREFLVVAA